MHCAKSVPEPLRTWQVQRDVRALDKNRVERTLTCSDPKSGLAVRCVAIQYEDFLAVEWLLHSHNGGEPELCKL